MIRPIRQSFTVPLPVEQCFELFVNGFGSWWPKEYSWSGDDLQSMQIEPRDGGRCTEIGPFGFQVDWGRVIAWQPPTKLIITWQIDFDRRPQPNPEYASIIEIEFQPDSQQGTAVSFEHRSLEKHGEQAENYRTALSSEVGWPFILGRFREKCRAN